MKIELYRRLMIHNKKGELVSDTGKVRSHSFVIQFLELIYAFLGLPNGTLTATDVNNAENFIYGYDGHGDDGSRVDAPQGNDNYGIVVGLNTGASPEDNLDYDLDSKIDHSGVGAAGDLNYQAVTFIAPVVDGANVDFDISRPFLNESGNPITVDEIGLIGAYLGAYYHLFIRDVIGGGGQIVADDETLTVVYTLRTTA